ncbi:hypothetical protein J6590_107690, partial [Homalodisca vitripennis]
HTLNTDCEKIGTTSGGLERSKISQPTWDLERSRMAQKRGDRSKWLTSVGNVALEAKRKNKSEKIKLKN